MLQWLRCQDPPCPWDEFACSNAATNGHLHILRWLRSQDPPCPWNANACTNAAIKGHLHVLQWLRSQDPPCPWDKQYCLKQSMNHIRNKPDKYDDDIKIWIYSL